MGIFDKDFRKKLTEEIGKIEKVSGVEVVCVVARYSSNYMYLNLIGGIFLAFATLTFMMFTPDEFSDEWVYFSTVISFSLGFLLMYIGPFARVLVPDRTLLRNSEIFARALFQKGQIYETGTRQGILIYISGFERKALLIEDINVIKRIPFTEMQKIKDGFNLAIRNSKPAEKILSEMENMSAICAKYIPIEPDDVNELPDDLEILL